MCNIKRPNVSSEKCRQFVETMQLKADLYCMLGMNILLNQHRKNLQLSNYRSLSSSALIKNKTVIRQGPKTVLSAHT